MRSCATCCYSSRSQLEALKLDSPWSGKRILTDAEKAGSICTRAATPVIVTDQDLCPLWTPGERGAQIASQARALLLPWLELRRLREDARKGLDRFAGMRDDALVARTALQSSWQALVDLWEESGADLRGSLSADERGAPAGRDHSDEWYAGWDHYAHRVHAKAGLMLKRLSHLRERCESVKAAIAQLDVGRPDVLSSLR